MVIPKYKVIDNTMNKVITGAIGLTCLFLLLGSIMENANTDLQKDKLRKQIEKATNDAIKKINKMVEDKLSGKNG